MPSGGVLFTKKAEKTSRQRLGLQPELLPGCLGAGRSPAHVLQGWGRAGQAEPCQPQPHAQQQGQPALPEHAVCFNYYFFFFRPAIKIFLFNYFLLFFFFQQAFRTEQPEQN